MKRLAIALLVFAAACGSTEPSSPSLSGVWNSSDQIGAWRDVQLQLTQHNSTSADGAWVATSTASGTDASGLLDADLSSSNITVTFSTNFGGQMTLHRVSDTRLTGTAAFSGAAGFPAGPFPVTFDYAP